MRSVVGPRMGAVTPWGGEPTLPEGRFEQMRTTDLEYMRIISCNPDAIKVIVFSY